MHESEDLTLGIASASDMRRATSGPMLSTVSSKDDIVSPTGNTLQLSSMKKHSKSSTALSEKKDEDVDFFSSFGVK